MNIIRTKPRLSLLDRLLPLRRRQRERDLVEAWIRENIIKDIADGSIAANRMAEGTITIVTPHDFTATDKILFVAPQP